MPVSSNRSLGIKSTNATNSSFIVITTLHVSYSLSAHHQEFLALHRLWCILCSCDDRLLLHPAPGGKRSSQLHKMYQSRCTAKNSWWWAERLPETCKVVIPIKLEFSASVGFIHKESVAMHGHTIIKKVTARTAMEIRFVYWRLRYKNVTYHLFDGLHW